MVYAPTRNRPRERVQNFFLNFEIQIDHQISARRDHVLLINNKKIGSFTVSMYHRIKIKENEKIEMYLDLGGELNKQRNIRMMVILVVIRELGIVP